MFDKLIAVACFAILVLMFVGVSRYENAADKASVITENQVIRASNGKLYACPTVKELQQAEWSCSTDSECDQQYKTFFGVDPWECGDQS